LLRALLSNCQANEATSFSSKKGNVLGGDNVGSDNQITLILSIFII